MTGAMLHRVLIMALVSLTQIGQAVPPPVFTEDLDVSYQGSERNYRDINESDLRLWLERQLSEIPWVIEQCFDPDSYSYGGDRVKCYSPSEFPSLKLPVPEKMISPEMPPQILLRSEDYGAWLWEYSQRMYSSLQTYLQVDTIHCLQEEVKSLTSCQTIKNIYGLDTFALRRKSPVPWEQGASFQTPPRRKVKRKSDDVDDELRTIIEGVDAMEVDPDTSCRAVSCPDLNPVKLDPATASPQNLHESLTPLRKREEGCSSKVKRRQLLPSLEIQQKNLSDS